MRIIKSESSSVKSTKRVYSQDFALDFVDWVRHQCIAEGENRGLLVRDLELFEPKEPPYRGENPRGSLRAGVQGIRPCSESLSPLDNNVT